jgi:hypothetical protein
MDWNIFLYWNRFVKSSGNKKILISGLSYKSTPDVFYWNVQRGIPKLVMAVNVSIQGSIAGTFSCRPGGIKYAIISLYLRR